MQLFQDIFPVLSHRFSVNNILWGFYAGQRVTRTTKWKCGQRKAAGQCDINIGSAACCECTGRHCIHRGKPARVGRIADRFIRSDGGCDAGRTAGRVFPGTGSAAAFFRIYGDCAGRRLPKCGSICDWCVCKCDSFAGDTDGAVGYLTERGNGKHRCSTQYSVGRFSTKDSGRWGKTSEWIRRNRAEPRGYSGVCDRPRWTADRYQGTGLLCSLPGLYQKCGIQRDLFHLAGGNAAG